MATMPEIKVVVEQAIHKGLADALQHISAEHSIQVTSISVDWICASTAGESTFIVREIKIDSFYQPSGK